MSIRRSAVLAATLLAALCAPAMSQEAPRGNARMTLTFNPTPDPSWNPGGDVILFADARRNPNLGQEDIFSVERYGERPRVAGQQLDFTAINVKVGEEIIVQGYMCAAGGSTDCYPSDSDNPPSCSVRVRILGGFRPSCRPTFTWSGGSAEGGVLCRAQCL